MAGTFILNWQVLVLWTNTKVKKIMSWFQPFHCCHLFFPRDNTHRIVIPVPYHNYLGKIIDLFIFHFSLWSILISSQCETRFASYMLILICVTPPLLVCKHCICALFEYTHMMFGSPNWTLWRVDFEILFFFASDDLTLSIIIVGTYYIVLLSILNSSL